MFMVSFKFNNFMFRDLEYVIDPAFSMNSGDFVRFMVRMALVKRHSLTLLLLIKK